MPESSILKRYASLPADVRERLKAEAAAGSQLDPLEFEAFLAWHWPFWARPSQLEPAGEWTYWVILSGRGFGKTRAGSEWVRSTVAQGRFSFVNLIGATADDARDIMIEGESGILAVCPPRERPEYMPSKRQLAWPNGCRSLIFTADEPERLRGKQHQRLWADEVASWRYEEAWDQAMLGLRLGPDPRALVTTTPKPRAILRDLLARPRVVVTRGTTYENRDNLAPEFFDEIIRKYEGTRLGRQELEAELLLDEGLAYRVEQGVHLVPPFPIPDWWQRFEAMDYGRNHPTAWPVFAVDHEGNVVVFDMYYSPGMVAEHARAVLERRKRWWPDGVWPVCYGPPDIKQRRGIVGPTGREATVETEFAEHGITFAFAAAQTDRRAGYARVEAMLTRKAARVFPDWHPLSGQPGSPSLFIFDIPALTSGDPNDPRLVEQLRDAPLEDISAPASRLPGEAIDQAWEGEHGHAHAALRYGLMAREPAGVEPEVWIEDPRERMTRELLKERLGEGRLVVDRAGYMG